MNFQSENINELATALAKAQGQMVTAKKDKKNPFFKSTYADLSSIWDACRNALSQNGLAVIQTTQSVENRLEMVTTLVHSSGQWIKSQMPILVDKPTPQAIGSAQTYYRRYALAAIVGVVASEEDDDGNAASGIQTNGHVQQQQPKISSEKADELIEILEECDSKYQNQVMTSVKGLGFSNLYDVNQEVYDKIKAAALKKRQESKKTKQTVQEHAKEAV